MHRPTPGVAAVGDLAEAYVSMALARDFLPVSHLTLTFGQGREMVTPERASWMWRRLVRRLNEHVGGRNYRRKWGHSYFGYILGVERHRDGVPHAHAVIDNWIDYSVAHSWWQQVAGWLWIRQVGDDPVDVMRYVLKYVVKEDAQPSIWFQPERREVEQLTGRVFRAIPTPQPKVSRTPAPTAGALRT